MDAALIATIVVVVIAVGFDFTNGFHDAANAIATSVGTLALTPTVALGLAAVFNFIGALNCIVMIQKQTQSHENFLRRR